MIHTLSSAAHRACVFRGTCELHIYMYRRQMHKPKRRSWTSQLQRTGKYATDCRTNRANHLDKSRICLFFTYQKTPPFGQITHKKDSNAHIISIL